MTDELQIAIDRIAAELAEVREAARVARADKEGALRARLTDVDATLEVRRHKLAELEARLRSLYVRNAELRRALLQLE